DEEDLVEAVDPPLFATGIGQLREVGEDRGRILGRGSQGVARGGHGAVPGVEVQRTRAPILTDPVPFRHSPDEGPSRHIHRPDRRANPVWCVSPGAMPTSPGRPPTTSGRTVARARPGPSARSTSTATGGATQSRPVPSPSGWARTA